MTPSIHGAALVASAVVCLVGTARAQDYEIRLHRPLKVGQRFGVSTTASHTSRQTTSVGGRVAKQKAQDFSVEFASAVTVLATDAQGRPTRESHTVSKCLLTKGGATRPLLAEGTVVIAFTKGVHEAFEVNGTPVADPQSRRALSLVVSLTEGGPTYDELFGTPERKRPGQSWSMDSKLAAADMRRKGMSVQDEGLSGTVTLERVVAVNGTPCLELSVALEAAKISPRLPPAFTITHSALRSHVRAKLPIDVSLRPLEESTQMSMSFRAEGQPNPNAPQVVIEVTVERHRSRRWVPQQ